jgi:transcriptional regulator with XRE-family HTH domain
MTLGVRIMELRKAKGLSQAQLGKLLSLSQPALANYERDVRDPPASFLLALCNLFKANPCWLLQGKGNMFEQNSSEHNATAMRIAWTYLLQKHGSVDAESLMTLSNALYHYLMEHGSLTDPMRDIILSVAA